MDDYFGTEWVPSHQSDTFQNNIDLKTWNTIGIPTKEISTSLKRQDDNQIVRKAVRDIESGMYNKDYQDRQKDVIEEKIDITQAKLYWLEKEKNSNKLTLNTPVPADYYTDYPTEGERDENVIVLKIEQSDGLILKPDTSILLTSAVPEKPYRRSKALKLAERRLVEPEKENFSDYEKNWNQHRNYFWDSDSVRGSPLTFKGYSQKIQSPTNKLLKFQTISNTNERGGMIPRVKPQGVCRGCNKLTDRENCSGCKKLKSRRQKLHNFIDAGSLAEKKISKDDYLWFSLDSQRSRKNFFGNSGSYTLRCNLNPISKTNNTRKRFYLTPETLQLGYLKKLKEPKIIYENFKAKKREFKKQKGCDFTQFDGSRKSFDTVMW